MYKIRSNWKTQLEVKDWNSSPQIITPETKKMYLRDDPSFFHTLNKIERALIGINSRKKKKGKAYIVDFPSLVNP